MIDYKLAAELKSDDIIMESFHDMAISQIGKDRIKYIDVVTEAFSNPTKQANLLNKLFKEIQKVEQIDFGKIPDSKGDVTKYVYYDQMYECIEVLNTLVEGNATPNITTMNKLHQILLSARPDFTFGFRTDNYIIVTTYNLMVTTLYEMINICAVDATEYLRNKMHMQMTAPSAKQIRWVTKNANQLIKMYENGQWSTLMKTFKSNGGSIVIASEAATESDNEIIRVAVSARADMINNAVNAVKSAPGKIHDIINGHPKAKLIVVLIVAFLAMRGLIYYFINCAGKLSDRLKNITTILRANAASENSPSALEKQKKMLDNLENLSDTIDYKIVKSEKAAEMDMKKANKVEFNPQEINNISGADFEI